MGRYILKRMIQMIPIVILVSIVAFTLLHLAPGGPTGLMTANPKVSGDDIARIRENYGLDRPLLAQYFYWFRQVFLRFDFGRSYVNGREVSAMILERIPATLELMLSAFLAAVVIGGIFGVVSALKRGTVIDDILSIISIMGMSVPVFWLGLMAIYIFSLKTGLLPSGGRMTVGGEGSFIDHLAHLVLPASVLSLTYLATWSRYLRTGLIDAFRGDFILTARAKGLNEKTVIMKHALRNGILPAMNVVIMQIPTIFTGAVITETVFSWPGMGRLFYEGLQRQDYTRVLGIIVISSLLIIFFNFLGDLMNFIVDPRIKADERNGTDVTGSSILTTDYER
ncbi:MAG: ABC transporter permease [Candidatus Krumholzibacteriota bacterium]|nr:ABC transporter permease [Candidatus Krumholzibacteriota bacterium]